MPNMSKSHIYIANFANEETFNFFIEEVWPDDEDDTETPLSPFYGSQGEVFCDHDFMQSEFFIDCESVADVVKLYEFADQIGEDMLTRSKELGVDSANSYIMIEASEIDAPKDYIFEKGNIVYLGAFHIEF